MLGYVDEVLGIKLVTILSCFYGLFVLYTYFSSSSMFVLYTYFSSSSMFVLYTYFSSSSMFGCCI